MLENGCNNIVSPRPIYSPQKSKYSTSRDNGITGGNPPLSTPTPVLSQQTSSSAHSVNSLDESNSTIDSGFQSVLTPQPLVPSPNSAFSPRFPVANAPMNTQRLSPNIDNIYAVYQEPSLSPGATSSNKIDYNESIDTLDRSSMFSYEDRSSPNAVQSVYSNGNQGTSDFENEFQEGSSNRRRRRLSKSSRVTDSSDEPEFVPRHGRRSVKRYSDIRPNVDRKSLLDNFITQAEERDRRAKREQRAVQNLTKNRTRSSSLTRSGSSVTTPSTLNGSFGLKRSNSTNTRTQPPPSNAGIRRSSSSVDISDIIKKAESRDRHARVDQARLEGLLPPRRYLGRKDSINTRSRRPASLIINDFEGKTDDEPPLTGRSQRSDYSQYSGDFTPREAAKSHHRKFSSFRDNSRLSNNYSGRSRERERSYVDSAQSSLRRTHSGRSSTWNGTEINRQKSSVVETDSQPSYNNHTVRKCNDEDFEPVRRIPQHTPRSAISMGNLQQTSFESEQGLQPSWKKDRFEQTYKPQPRNTAYTNQRQKAASALNLQTVPQAEPLYNGRPERQPEIIENRPLSGRRKIPSDADALPSPPPQNSTLEKHYQSSLDNPNYDHFPPPPPELEPKKEELQLPYKSPSPKVVESPRSLSDLYRTASPAGSYDSLPRSKPTSASSLLRKDEKSSKSQTLGRPSSGRKTDALKLNPAQKKSQTTKAANKSSTLPRHFKSTSPWDRDEREKREQVIQEELNALRDEEINELSSRSDLSPLEEDRLKNLLQEREFQNRVQEERMKMFSDEDISEEDYGVPDRPDRDRLIRLEDAQRDAAALKEKEDRDHALWEEEQRRKKEEAALRSQQEAERREARRREREKRERERQEEKKRKEEEQMKEEKERMMREKQKEEFFRSNNDIEERLQREEMEQRQRLEELRRMREEEENQLRELQVKREAEERSFRHQTELRRRQDRISKQKEAEAREEAEREYLENMLSAGKKNVSSAPYRKTSSTSGFNPKSPSYTQNFVSKPQSFDSSRPVMREHSGRQAMTRPVSDGYMLGRTDWDSDHEHSPPPPTTPPASSGGRRPISYVATGSTPGVIGSQEIYKDPRNRREADIKRDQSFKRRGPDPSKMTFKDRQKLFQGSKNSPVSKPKTSRKLLEIEENLRSQM